MLSCKYITDYASDYVEGKMNFWQRLKFKSHLSACVHCARFQRHLGVTISFGSKCAHQYATEEEVQAILDMVKAA